MLDESLKLLFFCDDISLILSDLFKLLLADIERRLEFVSPGMVLVVLVLHLKLVLEAIFALACCPEQIFQVVRENDVQRLLKIVVDGLHPFAPGGTVSEPN